MIHPYKGIYPVIHPTVFVVDSAIIIGDVVIGEYSSVWFNAVIRGDVNYIRIGKRTNIQDLCMLHVTKDTHPLILGDDITVGHSVTLHGCTIKNRCLIGMGATILDGAIIEEDCIIGAGAVVTEGSIIKSGTLAVGVPARPKRPLTEEEKARIVQSAKNYIEYSKTFRL